MGRLTFNAAWFVIVYGRAVLTCCVTETLAKIRASIYTIFGGLLHSHFTLQCL